MPDDANSRDTVQEMLDVRNYTYPGIKELWEADPEWAERYDNLAEYNLRRDDALSRKTRELIIIAYSAIVGQVDACRNHIVEAYDHGASHEEILQTIQLAGHIGGGWTPVTAAKALDELDIKINEELSE